MILTIEKGLRAIVCRRRLLVLVLAAALPGRIATVVHASETILIVLRHSVCSILFKIIGIINAIVCETMWKSDFSLKFAL